MNNNYQDSTNHIAEKLSLTRELAVLKPELDHLRSQLTHQQQTLAEKLGLERQVSTLEVELANEKKATMRALRKRESTDRAEDELQNKLRDAEKQLAAERTQRERLEDQLAQEKETHQIALQEQGTARESTADLRKKLQDAQRELQEAHEDKERLEEELQAEKRRAKKALSKASDDSAVAELQAQLEEIQEKLLAEEKQKEKIRKNADDAVAAAESRSSAYEKKLEKMKAKLQETQSELKQCQENLRKAQKTRPSVADEVAQKTAGRQAVKKRRVQESTGDELSQISIDTPHAGEKPKRVAAKKKSKATEPSLLGEKSTFSITPFLNRAKSANEDAAESDDEELEDTFIGHTGDSTTSAAIVVPVDAEDEVSAPAAPPAEPAEPQPHSKARGRPKKALTDASSATKNAPLPKAAVKKASKSKPVLENVAEEPEDSQDQAPQATQKTQKVKSGAAATEETAEASAPAAKGEEPKKKKRKVLGATKTQTLFEEEDAEDAPAKPPPGGAKLKNKRLGAVQNAFADKKFSPLKRDRRGVGASFLA